MTNRNSPADASPVPPPDEDSGNFLLPIAVNIAVVALGVLLFVLLVGSENRVSFPPYVPPAGTVEVPPSEPAPVAVPAANGAP